jgi:hypothetical protein
MQNDESGTETEAEEEIFHIPEEIEHLFDS